MKQHPYKQHGLLPELPQAHELQCTNIPLTMAIMA